MIGTTLGRYRILEPIGAGGMGQVYLAEDPTLHRRVAIKVLPGEFTADAERRDRLLHEARAASALNHPNILTIHDLGEDGGVLYVAMEWIEGRTLAAWAGAGSRTPGDCVRVIRQAARALAVAHAEGLVHRDLKPDNLMVRHDGLLKILDFGLARSVTPTESSRTMTMPGVVLGTAPYMSPEQVLGQPAGPASDVFSLGTVLYELVTGRHPFDAGSPVETMHRILHEMPQPPSRLNPALPVEFDFVLLKALAKEPGRRYANARELDVDLDTVAAACAPAPAPAPAPEAAGPRTLAVLPFKNIGGNPELNYLGIGLADAVITRLSDSPDLVVRATSSIARYENQPVDPRRVGHELEVSAVLDASFQRAGERFRATARLVEVAGGRALWAGKVDLKFEDIFEVQDQVAHGIAHALTARLAGAGEEEEESRRFTPSAEAFEAYMRGQEAMMIGTRTGNLRGIELLERAIALEPDYVDAIAALASLYHGMIDGAFDPDPRWYEMAEQLARRALALDPTHARAHFEIAALDLVRGRKSEAYAGLIACLRRLPNHPLVHHYFAYLFRLCDMLDEAIAAELRAIETDPSTPWPYWMLARIHVQRGDTQAAREVLERARTRFGSHPRGYSLELGILSREGRYEDVRELDQRLGSTMEESSFSAFERAFAYLQLNRPDLAAPHIERDEAHARTDMDVAAYAAALAGLQGDPDTAFRHLARAVELGNDSLSLYEDPRMFGSLHGDPRWEPFLAGVRSRVARWRREFRWPPEPGGA